MWHLHSNLSSSQVGFIIIVLLFMVTLFIGGILFLIIYGLRKQKPLFWVSGIILAALALSVYFLMYFGRMQQLLDSEEHMHYQQSMPVNRND